MKTTVLTCFASVAVAWSAFGQDPTATPAATASASATTPAATATVTATASDKDDLQSRIERKVKRGLHVTVDADGDSDSDRNRDRDRAERHIVHRSSNDNDELGALVAIPIVGIIFGTIFLAPVLLVSAILLFNYMRQRSLHRTVRMMVEKGQEVPAALFAAPPVVRARSDMRRGVVLLMVGLGIMLFLGAVNDWEGGAWALGLIPFLMGAGYLTVWRLEGNKPGDLKRTDNPPPLP